MLFINPIGDKYNNYNVYTVYFLIQFNTTFIYVLYLTNLIKHDTYTHYYINKQYKNNTIGTDIIAPPYSLIYFL